MLRVISISTLLFTLVDAAPSVASVYTGQSTPSLRPGGQEHPAGVLFPGVIYGDASELSDKSTNLSKLVAATNDFFGEKRETRRPQNVASLYGEPVEREEPPPPETTDTTIPVVISGEHQEPIQVFTGADTSHILSQLFSGILNVNDSTFVHRRGEGSEHEAAPAAAGRPRTRTGSVLTSGTFLATQPFLTQGVTQDPWINENSITQEFPAFEEKKPVRTSEMMESILRLLNPYFYGGLLLLVVFSAGWSLCSRFIANRDAEP